MTELFVDYGIPALGWVAAALTGLLARYVWVLIRNATVRAIVERGYAEARDAVLEVGQTYADEIRKARPGGLTDEEKAHALAEAIKVAKANLGSKGLARLGRALGVGVDVDGWLQSKVEATVKALKLSAPAAPAPAAALDDAVTAPVPRVPA